MHVIIIHCGNLNSRIMQIYVRLCPSPVVCDEHGHPNFWRLRRRTPKLNVIFLPSSSMALLKGERKCSNVRHETSGNWKETKDTACFKMYQQQYRRGREERPVQITGAQLCCICCVFLGSVIICGLYTLTLSHLFQVTLQLTVNLSYIV